MKYELIKQLKDAGFPHELIISALDFEIDGVWYKEPTLSELVKACGEDLGAISRKSLGGWSAFRERKLQDVLLCGEGPTIEEAIANLYLALYREKNRENI